MSNALIRISKYTPVRDCLQGEAVGALLLEEVAEIISKDANLSRQTARSHLTWIVETNYALYQENYKVALYVDEWLYGQLELRVLADLKRKMIAGISQTLSNT